MGDRLLTVVLIEDHPVVRDGIRLWCMQADPPIELVDAGDRVADAWTGAGAGADVVVLDLEVEGKRQYGAVSRLAESSRHVVVYTQHADSATAAECLDRGALAYVTKLEGEEHLIAAIRAAAEGTPYTPPSLSGAIAVNPKRARLSPQEIEALRHWCTSSSKAMAAARMYISVKTLDSYIQRARVKCANVGRPVPTKAALVVRALEEGWITKEDLAE